LVEAEVVQNTVVLSQYCFKSVLFYYFLSRDEIREQKMADYANKSYGRNGEVEAIYQLFLAHHDLLMPGPRRLGKTFVLERVVEQAPARGWIAIKVEIAGCTDERAVFRELCEAIGRERGPGKKLWSAVTQRLSQLVSPRSTQTGPWYEPILSVDHESLFERLVQAMHNDPKHRWALLIDELPIFLKALHDRGPEGVARARAFMNLNSRMRQAAPRVRWLVTGSIGIEPLATAGDYMGVLAKFQPFDLSPLSPAQATHFVQDLAALGQLPRRQRITDLEAHLLVQQVGWHAAYYLDALTRELAGTPTDDEAEAQQLVAAATDRLLQPERSSFFGTWPEHLRKHFLSSERVWAFAVLAALASQLRGLTADALLAQVDDNTLTRPVLMKLLQRLHVEGFVTVSSWGAPSPTISFRNPLLRLWWQRFPPQAST
jgi:uncharacterized protein